jgi:hypothetical protein
MDAMEAQEKFIQEYAKASAEKKKILDDAKADLEGDIDNQLLKMTYYTNSMQKYESPNDFLSRCTISDVPAIVNAQISHFTDSRLTLPKSNMFS